MKKEKKKVYTGLSSALKSGRLKIGKLVTVVLCQEMFFLAATPGNPKPGLYKAIPSG